MRRVTLTRARAELSELIDAVLAGEEIVITRRRRAVVRLTVLEERVKPEAGRFKDRIQLSDRFDDPLDDFQKYSR